MSNTRSLSDIWNLYTKQVVVNEKVLKPSKPGPGSKNLNDPKAGEIAQEDSTGPGKLDGPAFKSEINDKKKDDKKGKKQSVHITQHNLKEKIITDIEKNTGTVINNNMKSTFDKLFEDVMNSDDTQDLQALDADMPVDDAGTDTEESDVTVTLTADQVQCLRDILGQLDGVEDEVIGDEDVALDDAGEGGFGSTEEDNEDKVEDEVKKEATEMKELPDSAGHGMTKASNGKVTSTASKLAKSGKADSKVASTVDGTGKDVPDSAGQGLTKKANDKPASKVKGKNQEFFGV